MSDIIEDLERFNRKERYHLMRTINSKSFDISGCFQSRLEEKLNIKIPAKKYVAIDYHIDWIYGSFFRKYRTLSQINSRGNRIGKKSTEFEFITGTQEDIDLLIVYNDNIKNTPVFIFIEAKGDMKWDQDQLESKLKRLNMILNEFNSIELDAFFVLMSPNPIEDTSEEKSILTASNWRWPKGENCIPWLQLVTHGEGTYRIVRVDENGKDDAQGKYWKEKQSGLPVAHIAEADPREEEEIE